MDLIVSPIFADLRMRRALLDIQSIISSCLVNTSSLDFAKAFYERFIGSTIEFTLNYLRTNHSWYFEFFRKLFGAKINTKMEQLSLLDSNEFREYKRYMIYLFKKES